jgi:hypothetical protein
MRRKWRYWMAVVMSCWISACEETRRSMSAVTPKGAHAAGTRQPLTDA